MKNIIELIAPCGLFCGSCPVFRAQEARNIQRRYFQGKKYFGGDELK